MKMIGMFEYLLGISSGLSINLDQPLLEDGLDLLGAQSVLQTVPKLEIGFIPGLKTAVGQFYVC